MFGRKAKILICVITMVKNVLSEVLISIVTILGLRLVHQHLIVEIYDSVFNSSVIYCVKIIFGLFV